MKSSRFTKLTSPYDTNKINNYTLLCLQSEKFQKCQLFIVLKKHCGFFSPLKSDLKLISHITPHNISISRGCPIHNKNKPEPVFPSGITQFRNSKFIEHSFKDNLHKDE